MRTLLPIALLSLAALAGCLADDGTDDGTPTEAFLGPLTTERLPAATEDLSDAISSDHDGSPALHSVPELHEGSYGMELVGYNSLTGTDGGVPGLADSAPIAIDVWGDLLCVAHFAGSTGALGGATIVDISDPANPTVLSRVLSGSVNSDCQFTDDGQYLIVAVYTGAHDGTSVVPPPIGDAGANGMNLYDVSDPSDPVFLFHDAQGAGGSGYHNVFTAKIHDVNYVFQTYTGNVLKILEDGSGLEMVSQLEYADHDLWVGQHPITGEWTVVTGAGYGTAVFNMDDPANPELLSLWEGDRDNRYAGWHRQWPVDGTIDGKAYMVVAGEECGNGDSLPYQVLEWTDPEELTMTGTWWIPGHPANPGVTGADHLCEMNSHEFEVWDGYVATGNYHAGIWLFDVGSTDRVYEPATIGYYLPSEIPQESGGTLNAAFPWSPYVWGAYFDEDGYVYAADIHSGLYVLSFGATETG